MSDTLNRIVPLQRYHWIDDASIAYLEFSPFLILIFAPVFGIGPFAWTGLVIFSIALGIFTIGRRSLSGYSSADNFSLNSGTHIFGDVQTAGGPCAIADIASVVEYDTFISLYLKNGTIRRVSLPRPVGRSYGSTFLAIITGLILQKRHIYINTRTQNQAFNDELYEASFDFQKYFQIKGIPYVNRSADASSWYVAVMTVVGLAFLSPFLFITYAIVLEDDGVLMTGICAFIALALVGIFVRGIISTYNSVKTIRAHSGRLVMAMGIFKTRYHDAE